MQSGPDDSSFPLRELLTLALPSILQMVSYTLLQFADTYMLALVGDLEAAAAGSAGMIVFAFISFGFGVLLCINALVSQAFGRQDFQNCGRLLWQGIWVGLLLSVPLMLPVLFARPIFHGLGHEPGLIALEAEYLIICLSFLPIKLATTALGQFLMATNRPNWVFVAAVVAVTFNVVADYVLIFGHFGFPAMGVAGAAWGTNAALIAELLVLVVAVFVMRASRRFGVFAARPHWPDMRRLLKVGLPSGAQTSAEVFAWSIFMAGVIAVYGTTAIAANNYMFRYMMVSFLPAVGIANAVTALVGRYLGAGEPDQAVRRAHLGFAVAATYMVTCGGLMVLFRQQLMAVFTDDPAIAGLGAQLLIMAAIYQLFDAMYVVYNGALRGANDTLVPAVALALLVWTVMVGGGYVMAVRYPELGPVGAWGIACVYGLLLGGWLLRRFTSRKWKVTPMPHTSHDLAGA